MEISGSSQAALRHGDPALQESQILRLRAFVEDMQVDIRRAAHSAMLNLPVRIGDGEPRRVHHRDDGAHGRMDIAEDAHDPGMLEQSRALSARRIQADVEGLAAEIGKGVVKDRIEIREIHRAAHRDRHHVRA